MRHILPGYLAAAAFALISASEAHAQQAASENHLAEIKMCAAVQAANERLACYDRSVQSLDDAERRGDIIVVDRAEVRETRRQLFGFNLPSVPMFERSSSRAETIDNLSTKLTSAREVGSKWILTLENGSIWRQTDSSAFRFSNQPGATVEIRQGAMNSFLMRVGTSRSVRVERLR